MIEKAKVEGVIQKDENGDWRIVSIKKGNLWPGHYKSKESAKKCLNYYHKNIK